MFRFLKRLFKRKKDKQGMSTHAKALYGYKFPEIDFKKKPRKRLSRRYKEMKPPAFYGAGGTWVYPDSWYESFWQELKDKEGWTDKELKQGWRWRNL